MLTHRGVPKDLLDDTDAYWRHVYWAPMRRGGNNCRGGAR
jgi:hypothetical protein